MFAGHISIIGAGLSGLIAAHAWKQAEVFESSPAPRESHKALLRFRTDAVGKLVGIPFRKVRVHKAIFSQGLFKEPNILLANQYAIKTTGGISGDRSIWNMEAVDRYVAPTDFYDQLTHAVRSRIAYDVDGFDLATSRSNIPIVSTAPLSITAAQFDVDMWEAKLSRQPICVARYNIDADVFQTVYFPDPGTPIYRASITGNVFIVESMGLYDDVHLLTALRPFGLRSIDLKQKHVVSQQFGKIVDIDARLRKNVLYALTRRHNVYSLGRFATWRNILLDDVVKDIGVIDAMLGASEYERAARFGA